MYSTQHPQNEELGKADPGHTHRRLNGLSHIPAILTLFCENRAPTEDQHPLQGSLHKNNNFHSLRQFFKVENIASNHEAHHLEGSSVALISTDPGMKISVP